MLGHKVFLELWAGQQELAPDEAQCGPPLGNACPRVIVGTISCAYWMYKQS